MANPSLKLFTHIISLSKWRNPFEVDLGNRINWEKDFVGKAALKKIADEGPSYEMIGFEALDDDPYIRAMQYGGPGEPRRGRLQVGDVVDIRRGEGSAWRKDRLPVRI